ncbi:MAG TPA: hypothetical protein VII13_21975 [Vicinamibacteria bacterium]|jgi:hypothetical protein
MRVRCAAAVLALFAAPAGAEKLPPEFRAAFEQTFKPGRTFAVVMQEGVPTTSVYGVKGDQTMAHFSIDVNESGWKTSTGILDFDQTAADVLAKGEVMELASISWKDNRVDLRMVSVEAHKVTRGEWIAKQTKREPVATNFKFFFPFAVRGAQDVGRAIDFIHMYLEDFPSEEAARNFAATVVHAREDKRPAAAPARAASSAGSSAGTATKKEIKAGMTPLEVLEILGKPEKEISFENKSRWTYSDLTVVFENGRVKEVKF